MSVVRTVSKVVFATADLFLPTPNGPRILIYHQVGTNLGRQMEVTTSDFEWQLDWLSRNRNVVDIESALDDWNTPEADQLVVITFDDGFRDVYDHAFPKLLERRTPFTLYLSTGFIDSGDHATAEHSPLSWAMIDEMIGSGLVTIGAHTHTHADLRKLSKPEIVRELETSNEMLRSHLGVTPNHFAYPWGYWSELADQVVRQHYSSAAVGARVPRSHSDFDPWTLFRVPIQRSDGTVWFESRLKGGLGAEEWVRRRLKHYEGP